MQTSESIVDLAAALALAQAEVSHAKKDTANDFFKSSYADLAAVTDACRAALAKNGLAVVHAPASTDGLTVTVDCRLVHKSGQWMQTSLTLKPGKSDPQGIGSAITYARRYTLAAMVGVATEDDDGNAASRGSTPAQRETPPRANGRPSGPAPSNGSSNGHAANGSGRDALLKAVKDWTGMSAPEDVAKAMADIKKRVGITSKTMTDDEAGQCLAFVTQHRSKDFIETMSA